MKELIPVLVFMSFTLLGVSQDAKNVILLDVWNDTTIPIATEDARYSDLWTFETPTGLYCAAGSSQGVEILQIENQELRHVASGAAAFQGFTVIHRDYKTFQNYLYAVCDEGTSTLQIFDTSFLPDSLPLVYDSNTYFSICHNIYIDTATSKLYACGPNNLGMKVFDLSNPSNPSLIYDYNDVNYVHDAYVRNDTAFLNCGPDGLRVYDFSGPMPILLGLMDFYADQGYNHSGWWNPNGTYYAFIDEDKGSRLKLCETTNLSGISVSQTFAAAQYQDYTPHNIILTDRLAFVSYYNLGLRVYDYSQFPIREIAHYDTFHQETQYTLNGAWGVSVVENENLVLISDRQNGIFLFEMPIDLLDSELSGTIVTNQPFIDENSIIIPRDYFGSELLLFSIFATDGSKIYHQEELYNWMNIPLNISAGSYAFGIYTEQGELIESGKFVKAN